MKLSKTALQWIKFARTDLRMAKATLQLSKTYKNGAAFLAQQGAEKIVKAYLTSKKIRVPKTHDMNLLLKEVAKIDSVLAKKIARVDSLTIYAVAYRYPDAERKPLTVAKVEAAIEIAENAFTNCLAAIKSLGGSCQTWSTRIKFFNANSLWNHCFNWARYHFLLSSWGRYTI